MNSLIEVIKISKALKLSGTDFTAMRLNRMCDYSANLKQRFLLFSFLGFRLYFVCYPPESFKTICLTYIWSKFVENSPGAHNWLNLLTPYGSNLGAIGSNAIFGEFFSLQFLQEPFFPARKTASFIQSKFLVNVMFVTGGVCQEKDDCCYICL